jgi:hypothetical protein
MVQELERLAVEQFVARVIATYVRAQPPAEVSTAKLSPTIRDATGA